MLNVTFITVMLSVDNQSVIILSVVAPTTLVVNIRLA
jgi:hypothetical protein